MAKLNRRQLRGVESVRKGNKPSMAAPKIAKGKSFDDELENPRAYLKGIGDHVAKGHTLISSDLDHFDTERNPTAGLKVDE